MSITDDEFSCLMIAAQGEYMLAIGRWAASLGTLVAKGLMKREFINGGPQYTITDAGRAAIEDRDIEDDKRLGDALAQTGTAQKSAREQAEIAAQTLAACAESSAELTGDTPETAARKWLPIILTRALDIINNG